MAAVAGGYLVAAMLGAAAVGLRTATGDVPDAEASGGMSAFGDALLFVTVFGLVSLVPTGAAFVMLKARRRFWVLLAGVAAGIAVTGVVAVALFAVWRNATDAPTLMAWASLAAIRFLLAPLLALFFLVSGLVASFRGPRRVLLIAAAVELLVCGYAVLAWLLPGARG